MATLRRVRCSLDGDVEHTYRTNNLRGDVRCLCTRSVGAHEGAVAAVAAAVVAVVAVAAVAAVAHLQHAPQPS